MQTAIKKKITAADYEMLPEGPPQQLIDGEIIMSPSPNFAHQRLVIKISIMLENYVSLNNLGVVNISPIDVFLKEDEVYQPGIIFISKGRENIIGENVKGAPDLIVEVLSPSNAYYDLTHKKNVYEETGVKEFWVVDPDGKSIEIYENVKSTFILFSKAKSKGAANSKIFPGLKIELEKLFVNK
jgi:Uma2 family endonuclease